jgi:hypothetical protein
MRSNTIFWHVTPFRLVELYWRIREKYCLYLQGRKISQKVHYACCFLAYSLTLKMEAICSSEMSVAIQQTTRRFFPEDDTLHNHRCENLKSYIFDRLHGVISEDALLFIATVVRSEIQRETVCWILPYFAIWRRVIWKEGTSVSWKHAAFFLDVEGRSLKQQVPSKCWYLSTRLHSVISQETAIFIRTAVRTSVYCLVQVQSE